MFDRLKRLFAPVVALLGFIQNHFKALLFLLLLFALAGAFQKEGHSPNLAIAKLQGPILSAEKIVDELENLENDKGIKGVLLLIDSPGGAVAPSLEISLAVKRLAARKPVVAYAAGTMASGSYYAAIHATKIVANPAATVGSIGVIMEGINVHPLLKRIGVEPQVVKAGRYKEAGTPLRKWTPPERAEIERHVHAVYDLFVKDVAKARGLDLNLSHTFADAHIFIAEQARRVGLIDQVGSIADAKTLTAKLAGVKTPRWRRKSSLQSYLDTFAERSVKLLFAALGGWRLH